MFFLKSNVRISGPNVIDKVSNSGQGQKVLLRSRLQDISKSGRGGQVCIGRKTLVLTGKLSGFLDGIFSQTVSISSHKLVEMGELTHRTFGRLSAMAVMGADVRTVAAIGRWDTKYLRLSRLRGWGSRNAAWSMGGGESEDIRTCAWVGVWAGGIHTVVPLVVWRRNGRAPGWRGITPLI